MPRRVALLFCVFLVGCSGTIRGVRPGNGQDTLRLGLPVATSAQSPQNSLQGVSGEGLGNGISRAVLRLVPQGATAVADAGTVATTGKALVAGGAVVAAGGSVVLVCLTVKASLDGMQTPVDIADSFYGTHFGDLQGWVQGCYAPKATVHPGTPARRPEMKPEAELHAPPASGPASEAEEARDKKNRGRLYATYTKLNMKTGRHYSGRTSMAVDLRKSLDVQAEQAVDARDSSHHIDENDEPKGPGFMPAVLDEFDVGAAVDYAKRYSDAAYWRIRGREQQLIDSFGGAQSDTREPYRTENIKRGVAKDNPLGRLFHDAATKKWGQLSPCTGN